MDEGVEVVEAEQVDPATEAEARQMGWAPKAEWRGKETDWKSAAEYVDYGKHVLPILNATNKRLRDELLVQKGQIGELKTLVATSQEAIKNLNEFHTAETARQVAQVKAELGVKLKDARESGDTHAEVEIQSEIAELAAAEVAAKGKKVETEPVREAPPALSPAYLAYKDANPWLDVDMKKTRRALLLGGEIAEELRLNGTQPAFYAELEKRMVAEYGGASSRPGDSKVAGSDGAGASAAGGRGGGARGFASLPSEARTAAKSFERELVGPGKMHKDLASFHAAWATEYYRQEDKRTA